MAAKPFLLMTVALLSACGAKDSSEGATQRQQIGQTWKYEEKADTATGKPTPLAYLGSANSVKTLTAPDTFAVMLLQKMRNGETGVTIKAVGAPFTCDLSSCEVQAIIDGGKPKSWQGRMTDTKDGIAIPPPQNAFEAIQQVDKGETRSGHRGNPRFHVQYSGLRLAEKIEMAAMRLR